MEDSIFTKIVRGELPCHEIYEDDKTLAFLDIYPLQPGHALVIPKIQIEFVWDLPDDMYQALMSSSKKVALRIRDVMGTKYVGSRIIGVDVPHAHIQLIPFNDADDLLVKQDMSKEPDHKTLEALAKKLHF